MATKFPVLFEQFLLNDGSVAAGCLLDTFVTGTTTPLATFTDAAGTIPNTNPIVLDAAGCAVIFGNPEQLYTFRLRTPGGVLVPGRTRDDVAPIPVTSAEQFVPIAGGVDMTGSFNLSGNATDNLHPVPLQQVNTLIATAVSGVTTELSDQMPIGAVLMWFLSAPPTNCLILTGADLNRVDFADLFALWGTTFGNGDGINTFGTPDPRGRFPRGLDVTGLVDMDGATRQLGDNQADTVGPHTHAYLATANGRPGGAEGGARDSAGHGQSYTTSENSGEETRPKNFAVNFIVRVR